MHVQPERVPEAVHEILPAGQLILGLLLDVGLGLHADALLDHLAAFEEQNRGDGRDAEAAGGVGVLVGVAVGVLVDELVDVLVGVAVAVLVDVAVAVLVASRQIPDRFGPDVALFGELSLDGRLRHAAGVLPFVAMCLAQGIGTVIIVLVITALAFIGRRRRPPQVALWGIIGALTEDLIDTQRETLRSIERLASRLREGRSPALRSM